MDDRESRGRWIVRAVTLLLTLGAVGCGSRDAARTPVATPRAALAAAGQRLSNRQSAGDLTELARHGDRVLSALSHAERHTLARGYLVVELDREALVTVAAPSGHEPFWLAELGFARTGEHVRVAGGEWSLHRKLASPGRLGLGVNALDLSAPAHYAVFFHAPDGRPVNPRVVEGGRWSPLAAAAGVSLAGGADLPVAELPESLRGATLLRPSHDERHSTPLARGRVWKTRVVSGPRPDQVTVAYGADARHQLVWSWRTEPGIEPSVVRFYPVGSDRAEPLDAPPASATEARGDSRLVEVPELLNDPSIRRHAVKVEGLRPDTAYAYSVGDGDPSRMSPWAVVRTAPEPGRDVHLLYMGDPQCGLERWGRLLAAARARHPASHALLIAGDLVDRGNERSNWDHFFLRAAGVFDRLVVMPAVGNHEYLDRGPRLYQSVFRLPDNGPEGVEPGLVYSFAIGDVFVAVLDSTLAVSAPAEAERQARWLDEALRGRRQRWSIVMFHHPLYASHTSRQNLALRAAWQPMIDRHRVDLVIQGHDHAYLRTYPMREGRRVGSPSEGTVYVVSVSGDKYYDLNPRDYTEAGFTQTSTYQTIDLTGGGTRLTYRAYNEAGQVIDSFQVDKPRPAPDLAGR